MRQLSTPSGIDVQDIKGALIERVRSLNFEKQATPLGRVEIPIGPVNLLSWMRRQELENKIYWSSADNSFECAGVGQADCISGADSVNYNKILKQIHIKVKDSKTQKYYGGFVFDDANFSQKWNSFGKYYFLLPKFEILRKGNETVLACNIYFQKNAPEEIIDDILGLSFQSGHTPVDLCELIFRTDMPQKETFTAKVEDVIGQLNRHDLEKVVLARETVFKFQSNLEATLILQKLKDKALNCYHFYLQPDKDSVFLGASPEKLYKRNCLQIESEALAGTRPRGKSEEEDFKYEEELLSSKKDLYEHQFVVDDIRRKLESLCSVYTHDKGCSLLKLNSEHHLVTKFKAILKENVTDAKVLKKLHPTPAVAGTPQDKALECIREVEPFARGYYAGPVGYVGHDCAEFAVAIRSGLIQKDKISLYSGAGIVSTSVPEQEWEEIETKMKSFQEVIES